MEQVISTVLPDASALEMRLNGKLRKRVVTAPQGVTRTEFWNNGVMYLVRMDDGREAGVKPERYPPDHGRFDRLA
jgi:hypothetical protein